MFGRRGVDGQEAAGYSWKMIHKCVGGLRLFMRSDEPGRVYVADDSGSTPDQTDDGPLFINCAKDAEICPSRGGTAESSVTVSVLGAPGAKRCGGEGGTVWIGITDAGWLCCNPESPLHGKLLLSMSQKMAKEYHELAGILLYNASRKRS